jgi:hypothetical protein
MSSRRIRRVLGWKTILHRRVALTKSTSHFPLVSAMFFSRNKKLAVSNFVIKLLNNNCPDLRGLQDGPRTDSRVNLTLVVLVIPLEKKQLQPAKAFHAVTKDFSATSVSVMIDSPREVNEAIVAFRFEGYMYYARATAKHLTPLGGGFYQLGLQMDEMVEPKNYPKLADFSF